MKESSAPIPLEAFSLTHSQLEHRVDEWLQAMDVDYFIHKQKFRFFLRSVLTIDPAFTKNLVVYAVEKRLKGLIQDEDESRTTQLSVKIKEYYAVLSISNRFRGNDHYYFFCVYMTKLVADFLAHTFRQMDIDKTLEAEVYIILNFVMLGLEVSARSYEVNLNKVINTRVRKVTKKLTTNQKLQSISSLGKKEKRMKRLMTRKQTVMTYELKEKPSTGIEQFKEELNENLGVKPLPTLRKKVTKASQFDRQASQILLQRMSQEKRYKVMHQPMLTTAPPTNYLSSNQHSSSMELLLDSMKYKTLNHMRDIRIKHRSPHMTPMARLYNKNGQDEVRKEAPTRSQSREEVMGETKNWGKIIEKMRETTQAVTKFTRKHVFDKDEDSDSSEEDLINETKDEKEEKENYGHSEMATSSLKNSTLKKTAPLLVRCTETERSPIKVVDPLRDRRIFPKAYRIKRELETFSSVCDLRKSKTQYSVFNFKGQPLKIKQND